MLSSNNPTSFHTATVTSNGASCSGVERAGTGYRPGPLVPIDSHGIGIWYADLHLLPLRLSFCRAFAGTSEQQTECQVNGDEFFSELIPYILVLEGSILRNWRLQAMLMEAMEG